MVEPSITLAYSSSSFAFTQNSSSSIAAPTLVDNNQNAATATFSSFPALPNGLTFNTADGSVTGTPSSFQDSIKYTITATGTGDWTGLTATEKISIVVAPAVITINQATFDNNSAYQISNNTSIYVSPTLTIASHNVFFDLSAFSANNGNASYFIIDGTINFGILVGFNENVNLYGESESLINLPNQTINSYGILVGSTVSGSDTYTGNMYIDESVTANISSSVDSSGVYFFPTVDGSIVINGNFSVSSSSSYAQGVRLSSTAPGSMLNINGNFNASSSLAAYGVFFTSTSAGSATFNGNFLISSSTSSAYGVGLSSSAPGSTQNINGNFCVSSNSNAYGVSFSSFVEGSTVINGNFSVSSDFGNAFLINFNGDFVGSLTINGNFSISAAVSAIGVNFNLAADGSTMVNGNFSLFALSSVTSGVHFEAAPYYLPAGTPTFYSNKADSGNWKSNGGSETWNGGSTGTTADANFALAWFYDTPTNVQTDSHFSFLAISTALTPGSKTTFNNLLINAFENLSDGYVAWSVLANNIRVLLL